MDCKTIVTRLRGIRRETRAAEAALGGGNSRGVDLALDVIELHLQAIRAELFDMPVRK